MLHFLYQNTNSILALSLNSNKNLCVQKKTKTDFSIFLLKNDWFQFQFHCFSFILSYTEQRKQRRDNREKKKALVQQFCDETDCMEYKIASKYIENAKWDLKKAVNAYKKCEATKKQSKNNQNDEDDDLSQLSMENQLNINNPKSNTNSQAIPTKTSQIKQNAKQQQQQQNLKYSDVVNGGNLNNKSPKKKKKNWKNGKITDLEAFNKKTINDSSINETTNSSDINNTTNSKGIYPSISSSHYILIKNLLDSSSNSEQSQHQNPSTNNKETHSSDDAVTDS